MNLSTLKERLNDLEPALESETFVELGEFAQERRPLRVTLLARFVRLCRRGRIWKSRQMLTALKNAQYGFDEQHARSRGGRDGLFLLDRGFQPANEMMRKLFDRFLDRTDSEAAAVAEHLGVELERLLPVRLVSHHLRLLGLLHRGADSDHLVLVDWDDTK